MQDHRVQARQQLRCVEGHFKRQGEVCKRCARKRPFDFKLRPQMEEPKKGNDKP